MTNNILYIADGNYGVRKGRFTPLMQGQYGQSVSLEIRNLANDVSNLTGYTTITAALDDRRGNVYSITGAIALDGTPSTAPQATWTIDEADTGLAGTFDIVFTFSNGSAVLETLPVTLVIYPNPEATASIPSSLVGISTAQKALLASLMTLTGLANFDGAGAASEIKIKLDGTTAPTVNEDSGDGYGVMSIWVDTTNDNIYICTDATLGAANWEQVNSSVPAGSVGLTAFDTDVSDAFQFLAGCTLDTPAITVTSDGATITLTLQKSGGGDIRYFFSDGIHTHDCTPAATISLTAGTDTAPQINYIYILQSNKTLTVSTSGFPSAEHSPVAEVICQSAASLQTDGAYKVHVWTDHVVGTDGQGHLSHVNHWIRDQHATWESGVALTPSITTNAGSEDNVDIATTSGEVLQVHEHTFPAFDTAVSSSVYVVNHTTAYTKITDLNAADIDSSGNAITNNKYTSLVIWGVVNEASGDCKIMVNLPSAFYSSDAAAIADTNRYSVYTIPSSYIGVGFLIARLILKYTTINNGTWSVTQTIDLRGTKPSTSPGGTVAPATEFADSIFKLYDESDATKELAFQLSGITTGTTRTLTVPDRSGTPMLDDAAILSKTGAYQLAAGDEAKIIECNGTFTITCPDGLDTGFQCVIVNVGSGTITIAAATTLQGEGTQLATQYTGATVYHRGSNVWLAMGKLT